MKLPALDSYGDFYWVGHPNCENPFEIEKEFIEHRDELEFIGGVVDEDADYSYDECAVVIYKHKYYLLQTAGCSCPSPSETWSVVIGPSTKKELVAAIRAGEYKGYTLPPYLENGLVEMIEKESA